MKKLLTLILVIAISSAFAIAVSAAAGTVIYAYKTDTEPNMEAVDESWGKAAIHVDKNSDNSALFDYWGKQRENVHAEEVEFDLYCMYDDKYIYIAIVSPDYQLNGSITEWHGDGGQIWLQPLGMMTDPSGPMGQKPDISTADLANLEEDYLFIVNLNTDKKSYSLYRASFHIEDRPVLVADASKNEIQIIMRVPLDHYGIRKTAAHGTEMGIAVLRMSSLTSLDEGFAGGLTWGNTYDEYTTVPKSVNTMILWDPAQEQQPDETEETADTGDTETVPPETDPVPEEPDLEGASGWAAEELRSAILEGLVPAELQKNYTSPVTRGQVSEMFIKLIEKATGKTAGALIEEKGLELNEGKFEDTDDRNVILANALGVINGTSSTKFSPDGTLRRAQIAALINRVAKVCGVDTEGFTHDFTDITDNYSWVDAELGWPVQAGIIKGVGQGRFNPGGDLTTEQAILIVYRAYLVLTAE